MKKTVVQHHHLAYDPPIVVALFQSEHWCITQMNRRKSCSKGFIKALEVWIALNRDDAVDLAE